MQEWVCRPGNKLKGATQVSFQIYKKMFVADMEDTFRKISLREGSKKKYSLLVGPGY